MSDALLCIEITLPTVDPAVEDFVEAAVWELGAAGVERHDDQTFSQLVEDPRPRNAGTVRWRVFMEEPEDVEATVAPFREVLERVASVDAWVLDDLSFMTAWREHFRPTRVSPRLVVHPPWDRPEVEAGVRRVEIEPGMAFGTGTHETTRLCLAALDRLLGDDGLTVLDVGCGSGVLSIGASLLGARTVDAMDNDPDAVRIANENYAINKVPVRADTRPLGEYEGRYDIVVANILPHVLVALRDDLLARLADGGTLLLSGIIDERRQDVLDAFEATGAQLTRADRDGEWWALEMVAE